MEEKKLTIYADLNCPFCYSLHEHLMNANLLAEVEWHAIEHQPSTTFNPNNFQVQSELTTEITEVRKLFPETTFVVPPGRPNSRLAIKLLTEIQRKSTLKADSFRALLYRALWVEGRDFSDPDVLDEIIHLADFEKPHISTETLDAMQQRQEEWEQGDFSYNVPAMVTKEGSKLLGLPNPQLLVAFLQDNDVEKIADNSSICKLSIKETILIASNDDKLAHRIARSLQAEHNIIFAESSKETIDITASNNQPDLILIDADLPNPDKISICWMIRENDHSSHIPAIILANHRDDDSEIEAFDMGASDFVVKNISPQVLNARVRTLLRLKRANELLKELAQIDFLTEIPNRRELDHSIKIAWREGMRSGNKLSVILIDIDHFKNFNDNYGHIDGDKCLRKVARFLQCNINRPTDTVARYGGEEFILVLPNTDAAGAMTIAELVQAKLEQLNILHAHSPTAKHLTVSQGVASTIPSASNKLSQLIGAADEALYKAKKAGRNQIMRGIIKY
jgi:diguanylate cyclase (GGDEF)-like protein